MKTKNIVFTILGLTLLIVITISISYAIFSFTSLGEKENLVQSGTVDFIYTEKNELNISNAMPISDETGKMLTGTGNVFNFSVSATIHGNTIVNYEVSAVKNNSSTLEDNEVRLFLEKNGNEILQPTGYIPIEKETWIGSKEESMIIDKGVFTQTGTNEYTMKMWVAEDTVITENVRTYTITVDVNAKTGKDDSRYVATDNASYPELVEGMIPVIYNEGEWVKADLSKKWYQYEEQWWANAVTVSDTDGNLRVANPGTVIPMEKITGMFVWIPRFSYAIKAENGKNYYGKSIPELGGTSPSSSATPGAIDIKFVNSDVSEFGSSRYIDDIQENYRTPLAFFYGDENLDGFWMSKFELSATNNGCTTPVEDCYNATFIPNATSLVSMSTSNFFNIIYAQNKENNILGLKNDSEIKMIRSSEWEAAALLSQSIYGKYGNTDYTTTNKEIYQNKVLIAGKSNGEPGAGSKVATPYDYDEPLLGTGASTTGNIYGIYDMNGGTVEYMMSVYKGELNTAGGFTAEWFLDKENAKYFDDYRTTTYLTAINGGPVYELYNTVGWYGDDHYFVESSKSWLIRGGGGTASDSFGRVSGIFRYGRHTGAAHVGIGTRAVIVNK